MTMIRPETEMKDSGIAWIGDIPSNWETIPLKKIVVDRAGGAWGNEPYENNSTICMRIADFDFDRGVFQDKSETELTKRSYKEYQIDKLLLQTNDICIEKSGGGEKTPVGRAVLFDKPYDALFANFMDRIRVDNAVSFPKYVEYYLRAMYFLSVTTLYIKQTTGIQNLNVTSLLEKEVITLPSLSEQQAIADYLDKTCSKIDEIIAEAKASIDEYKELKQAVIFDGISLGTRKCCDYKRTTLKGIEKIPIEWEYRKLKFLIRYIESGVSVNAGNEPATELEYGVLKTSCVSKMIFLPSENKSVNKDEYDRVKCPVCGDTIIVSRMNTPDLVGACAYIEKNIDNIFLPDRLWQVHFNDNVNVKYIYYCLISPYIRNYYSSLSTGTSSSMQNISQGQFTNAIIPYPPLEEQKEIVDFLDKRTAEIDSLISEKESLINDLEAYKKSLIYEVVTGKRKVV